MNPTTIDPKLEDGESEPILLVNAFQIMVRRYLEIRLAELPADQRDDSYRRGLLDIHADLVGRGHPQPDNALATAMNMPTDVLRQLLGWPTA
jgi:hypothetical protein